MTLLFGIGYGVCILAIVLPIYWALGIGLSNSLVTGLAAGVLGYTIASIEFGGVK